MDQQNDKSAQTSPAGNDRDGLSVVGIGASAGGLRPLQMFFAALPPRTDLVFVVVLHLSPEHESILAELLQPHTSMPVVQVTGRVEMQPNHVYVIPPGKRLVVSGDSLELAELETVRGRRLQIDAFFQSLAQHQGDGAAVILSGAGSDGAVGIQGIKEKGGLILVQSPQEAEYDSMPRSVIATGLVDLVAPVSELAAHLAAAKRTKVALQLPDDGSDLSGAAQQTLMQILAQLRLRTGHDFNGYKRPTLLRRISRRMQITQIPTLSAYLQRLRQDGNELDALYRDLLIHVTEFFRDGEAWETLAQIVIPKIFAGKTRDDTVRAWTVGCATGEEAYSLTILLLEHAATLAQPPRIQVFASDLGKLALDFAREGVYPEAIAVNVSEERLERFFIKDNSHYRVRPEVRERILFTPHNLLQDPPFSKLDLITCRNLLIYLQRDIQDRVFESFHYALRPEGYLFLGSTESSEGAGDLFETVHKRSRIYQLSKQSQNTLILPNLSLSRSMAQEMLGAEPSGRVDSRQLHEEHHRSLEEAGPPSVLVDENNQVLHLSESAGRYLHQPGGALTSDVLRLVRSELQAELRSALFHVLDGGGKSTLTRPQPVHFNGAPHFVSMLVRPGVSKSAQRRVIIFFLEDETPVNGENPLPLEDGEQRVAVNELRAELRHTQSRLQTTREEYETTVEELRAANEELQSTNEEYRSTLEELETSKEELQSINEELQTLNQELQNKVEQVSQAHGDLQNLLVATEIATLFLDRDLCIKRYTPRAADLFNLMPADRGRPIAHLRPNLNYERLEEDARSVLLNLTPIEREVQGEDGRWFIVSVRPYRTIEDRIDGIVMTFVDVTANKEHELALHESAQQQRRLTESLAEERSRLEVALEAAEMGTWDYDLIANQARTDPRHNQIFGYSEPVAEWNSEIVLEGHMLPDDRARFLAAYQEAMATGNLDVEVRIRWTDGSIHWIQARGRVYYNEQGEPTRIAGVTLEITGRKEAQLAELRQRILEGQELERTQIAREIHDGPIQELAALTFELGALSAKLENEEVEHALSAANARIERNIRLLRHVMVTLRPPAVIEFGLATALQSYLEEFRQQPEAPAVDLTLGDQIPDLPVEIVLTLYRIFQQALHNVVQHAEASQIWARLHRQGEQLVMEVQDDGVGFTMPEQLIDLPRQKHLGIVGMIERAKTIGGELEIQSAPTAGTLVRVAVPLPS